MKKSKFLLAIFACCILASSCNNTGSNNTAGSDTTVGGKFKDAANDLGQAADKAASGMKQAVGSTANDIKASMLAHNSDSGFVADATTGNNTEMQLLQAGLNNGTNATLKSNAREMLADHRKVGEKMKSYALANEYRLPEGDGNKANDHLDKIAKKTGSEWDKSWTDMMISGHEDNISLFERGAGKVKDSTLKTLIINTLPTLRNHLVMMQNLRDKLKQ